MTLELGGLWVPVVTPFTADDSIDVDGLRRLCMRLLESGVRGIVALGTTGEPAVLTDDEQRAVIDTSASVSAAYDAPLIVGAGTNCTRTTLDALGRLAGKQAIAAALVVAPYYTRPSELAMVDHFRIVASASPVRVIAYNVPYRTGRALGAEALLALASTPNIIGVKQAVGALDGDTLEVLARAPSSFQFLAGDDAFIVPTMLMGGVGAIAAAAHVCTPLFVSMVHAAKAGDVARARTLAALLAPVVVAGFDEPSPAVWKGALHRTGVIATGSLRRPMTPASLRAIDELVAAIATANVGDPSAV